ncbi:unnamed protein product [Calicophoron daubneyi]|uniref:Mitochondrial inner membrane protein COX18 n=1 Tax=Calicophoron daubneyi TaxID=300641 RepID=A0AAV2TWI5_CALDB
MPKLYTCLWTARNPRSCWKIKSRVQSCINGWTQKLHNVIKEIRHVFRETCEKNNCHPLKSAATSLVQFPLWISLTFQLRNVCGFHTASGYGWLPLIPDFTSQGLTMACTSLVLPFSLLIIGLANVEIAHLRRPPPVQSNSVLKSWAYKSTRIVGWMGNLIIFYCSTVVPKALAIYWVTSATHQLFTHLLIMHPKVRQICNIWLLPNEGTEPYRRLLNRTMAEYAVVRRLFGRK